MKGARGFRTTWLSSMFSSTITKIWSKAGAAAAGVTAGADPPASSDVDTRTDPSARMRRTLARLPLQLTKLWDGGPDQLDPDDGGQDAQHEADGRSAAEVQQELRTDDAGQGVRGVEHRDGDGRFPLLGKGRREPIVDHFDEDAAHLFERALAAGAVGVVVGDLEDRGGRLGRDLQIVDDHRGIDVHVQPVDDRGGHAVALHQVAHGLRVDLGRVGHVRLEEGIRLPDHDLHGGAVDGMLVLGVDGGGRDADGHHEHHKPRLAEQRADVHCCGSRALQSEAGPTIDGNARLRATIIHGVRLVSGESVAETSANPSSPMASAAAIDAEKPSLASRATRAVWTRDQPPTARMLTKRRTPGIPSSTRDST